MNSPNLKKTIGFSPKEISSLINEDVVLQHAEEAAFLWILRDNAINAPNYSVKDLADLDERVEANLDGLRIAGQFGWKICEEALDFKESGEIFTAGVLAFESDDKIRIQKVLEIGCSSAELERALISALGWISFDQIESSVKTLIISKAAEERRVGIAAYAIHRKEPGPSLLQAVKDPDSRLRARAYKAAGELGRVDLLPIILRSISDKDLTCRYFAAWSAARLGERTAPVIKVLQEIAEESCPFAERALNIALRCMRISQAKDWCQQLRKSPAHIRLATRGAGIIGDPDLVKDLISLMEIEEVACVAGEAFSMITGLDLEYEDLDQDAEKIETEPDEENEEEEMDMDQDEDLPWPSHTLIRKWWDENKKIFRTGQRYLMGKKISKASLHDLLIKGNQRQRAAAALELGLLQPRQALFEVRAPGKSQLKIMAS